jgi:hypothetical protein
MLNEKGGERMYRLIETHINNGIEKATDTVPGTNYEFVRRNESIF